MKQINDVNFEQPFKKGLINAEADSFYITTHKFVTFITCKHRPKKRYLLAVSIQYSFILP